MRYMIAELRGTDKTNAFFQGTVKLNFPGGVEELADPLARFSPKPEIKVWYFGMGYRRRNEGNVGNYEFFCFQHLFREPEKRPPATVSSAFSIAVILPFVLLWGLVSKI